MQRSIGCQLYFQFLALEKLHVCTQNIRQRVAGGLKNMSQHAQHRWVDTTCLSIQFTYLAPTLLHYILMSSKHGHMWGEGACAHRV